MTKQCLKDKRYRFNEDTLGAISINECTMREAFPGVKIWNCICNDQSNCNKLPKTVHGQIIKDSTTDPVPIEEQTQLETQIDD